MPLHRAETPIPDQVVHAQQRPLRVAAQDATTLLPIPVVLVARRATTEARYAQAAVAAHARTTVAVQAAVLHRAASLRAVAHAHHPVVASLVAEEAVAVPVAVAAQEAADDKQSINI